MDYLQSAYEAMINASTFQDSSALVNILLNLAPVAKSIRNMLDELDTQTMNERAQEE